MRLTNSLPLLIIGITLAVNLAVTLGRSRRVNVIWMVRDPEIIEFYLRQRLVVPVCNTRYFLNDGARKTSFVDLLRIIALTCYVNALQVLRRQGMDIYLLHWQAAANHNRSKHFGTYGYAF